MRSTARWPTQIFLSPSAPPAMSIRRLAFVHEARLHGAHTVELNPSPAVGSEFAEKHYGLASEVVPAFIDKLLQENAL